MITIELKIEGMSCGHCVMSVKKALAGVAGVTVEKVEIGSAIVTIDAAAGERALVDAVGEAGYSVSAVNGPGASHGEAASPWET